MGDIRELDVDARRAEFAAAQPFPFTVIDGFLDPDLADAAAAAYRPFDEARHLGREYRRVNERGKVEIVDPARFPPAITRVADALASEAFLDQLRAITQIEGLRWDPTFAGGGMHQSRRNGWLDVHVDFNFNERLGYHRRLNLLLYLNPVWEESWGGLLELWDRDVKVCHHSLAPRHNRCVVFATSERSFHGVTALRCPPGFQRASFATYYYTVEPPPGWDGTKHSTIFRARPDERFSKGAAMRLEQIPRLASRLWWKLRAPK